MASEGDSDAEDKPLSRKRARKMARLTVAELKQLVKKPEVVEWTDVTAADPRILLHLKSYRNTVPIPIHWSAKRDYLQGKRGIEKPPFQLPAYIADTGIATMRDAVKEKEANMSLKAKTRERVQPKMGKVDIDYQKLHDAFFKFQTKPPVTGFGEMYVLSCCLYFFWFARETPAPLLPLTEFKLINYAVYAGITKAKSLKPHSRRSAQEICPQSLWKRFLYLL